MVYTITDIAELVEYQLVVSARDDDAAHANFVQLVQKLELLAPRPLWREVTCVFCDHCGCALDTDLVRPQSHHYGDDCDFLYADYWEVLSPSA